MQALKQSTATTILVGPVLDASGVAVTTAALADFNITKNGTSATLTGATVTHSHNGHYTIALTTGNTDTLGRLTITVNNSAMAMSPFRYTVLVAAAFDTLVTNGTLASTTSGRTIAVDASGFVTAGTVSDKTGYSLASGGLAAVTTWTVSITGSLSGSVGSVTGAVGSIGSGGITSASFATDSITSTALASSAVTEIQTGLATSANQTTIIDGVGFLLAQETGTATSPQTSAPVYATSFNGSTYTVTHAGVDATGVRGTATRAKT